MSEDSYFDILDVSASSRDFEILKVIIELFEEFGRAPTFNQIESAINSLHDESFTKQWIYKCLKNLEENKFITVDRITRPTTFSANLMDLRTGLSHLVQEKMEEIEKQVLDLKSKLQNLEVVNVYDLAYYLADKLTGKESQRVSGSIEGRMNIRQSLILELCERTKPGDVIRMNNRSNILDFSTEGMDSVENLIIESITSKGLVLKAMLNPDSLEIFRDYGRINQLVADNRELLVQGIMTGSIEVRAPQEDNIPYRLIAVNNDKMFMFLADTPKPDTVAVIYREGNPFLIDQAIENFELAWNDGINLSDEIMELIQKDSR